MPQLQSVLRAALLSRRRLLAFAAGAAMTAGLPGCSIPSRLAAVPRGHASAASVLGVPNERFFPTEVSGQAALEQEFVAAVERQLMARGLPQTAPLPELDLLGISGGGENGAFGAGLLNGWTEIGGRPTFFLVTGISTGALSAPFAFLGGAWDAKLKSVYTDITLADVLVQRGYMAAIWNDAMADNSPLFRTISRYLDEEMLAEIARSYAGGRLLLIGTSNLDAQMPVIWNIGAIAQSGHPGALETVRRILLASSAIPGAFAPVLFDAVLDGQRYQELHVDGGAFAQVFLYPASVSRFRRERAARRLPLAPVRAWVIRNSQLDPEWALVDRRTIGIAGRAITAMISASGLNDVLRIYAAAERDKVDYNLAFIRRDFTVPYEEPFQQSYMRPLFEYGRQRALRGDAWVKKPPF
ncbi:patatin-like phospholipase family protein [Teichococcus oryzae]|uniref:Patatin family protein n=1 Tax=Teichococcus oryzae TaxID=1608942 RepID=A0A5B2TEA6_9PROT|nr:patatin-like phospholipase family protein [Pseudoroseomonas oryzae]KAA2212832.1 patatin family protein [Pseudoroseomonas oryzae]